MNEIRATINEATRAYPFFTVIVHELKFDSIRQETYWVSVLARKYRNRKAAEAYAARYSKNKNA